MKMTMVGITPRRIATGLASALLAIALLLAVPAPKPAHAETDDIYAKADEAQQEVERSAKEYDEAVAKVDELNDSIEENERRKSDLEEQLPEIQEKGAQTVKEMYMMERDSASYILLVLDSGSFSEFMGNVSYLQRIEDKHAGDILALKETREELDRLASDLEAQKQEALEGQRTAEDKLKRAQELREEAQRKAQEAAEAEERARKEAEEKAAKEAAEAEKKEASEKPDKKEGSSASESSPSQSNGNSGSSGSKPADGIDWSQDKSAFVDSWGRRIDAYLAGSPMAGTGRVFAEAAWDHGIDPRWSPAISAVESGKGAVCFKPHNAWGWGGSSWPDWNTAIREHVAGLAAGYGYTVSVSAAQKYCPPNWKFWYDRCVQEMALI